jgi:hypothetical protein
MSKVVGGDTQWPLRHCAMVRNLSGVLARRLILANAKVDLLSAY